jgi:hypothetical protein
MNLVFLREISILAVRLRARTSLSVRSILRFLMFHIQNTNIKFDRPFLTLLIGRAVAQAVSRRLSTAAARVQSQVKSYGLCRVQSGTGAGLLHNPHHP